MSQARSSDRYLPPGTRVRHDGFGEGRYEHGVVVHCWLDDEFGMYDCYIAFFGGSVPEGRPADKPYLLRYAVTSLVVLEP